MYLNVSLFINFIFSYLFLVINILDNIEVSYEERSWKGSQVDLMNY
jgi:hypothetical protein